MKGVVGASANTGRCSRSTRLIQRSQSPSTTSYQATAPPALLLLLLLLLLLRLYRCYDRCWCWCWSWWRQSRAAVEAVQ